MENRLDLNTSVLKENDESYSSLTDLNNLQLFTDDFQQVVMLKESEELELDSYLHGCCFVELKETETADEITEKLFQSNQKIVIKQSNQKQDYGMFYMLFGSIIMGLLICSIVFGFRKKREERI